MFLYDPNAQLSPNYNLGDLTVTNQSLSYPNLPDSTAQFENLTFLADVLEELNAKIGAFRIPSAFRTKELQDKLTAEGQPTSEKTSFHELGRGVDIIPTTMSITDYFGRILADENLKNKFVEIAIKPGQGSIHLAINVPGDVREPRVMGLNTEGSYVRLSLDEIANYIAPFMESAQAAYDYAAAQLVTYNRTPLILGMVAAFGGVLYIALGSGSRIRKANPAKGRRRANPRRLL